VRVVSVYATLISYVSTICLTALHVSVTRPSSSTHIFLGLTLFTTEYFQPNFVHILLYTYIKILFYILQIDIIYIYEMDVCVCLIEDWDK
jgi:hypothetical protein